ncbi:forespore capture DNA-binding protein RefZ [Aneurinibacillus sp. Ricciae_BoGa-3]|uniref:forespore capture DNA-binding protein RefZ n=1 Tax=Aneurinibacillus sp. Ricciae_BoGa-3 TaxID=3022697 RepID=UPI0023411EEF|nr:forespore capture DNA-binding protein RefZ [Aneurinibacillus sp. Ricciae_BoGa-3]WCK55780.1 forespore capture DNA-binding protein RefZ [Aneurinibacillus sp. Ricciae_BoGa-3]
MPKRTPKQTKNKIVEAAIKLFDSQGFDGTTVRQIAAEANVNVALISYYFTNKKGLLEHVMVAYYEGLFYRLDDCRYNSHWTTLYELLTNMLEAFIRFQCESYQVTRLIQRELSVESMLGREIMSTYIARLKHYFASILEEGVTSGEFVQLSVESISIHLFSIMSYPYTHPQILREVFYVEPLDEQFVERMIDYTCAILLRLIVPGDKAGAFSMKSDTC